MSLSRIRRTLVPAVLAVALLSGCSSSNTAAPGVALSIGDDSISKSQVNRVADAVCQSIGDSLVEAGERVPMLQVKQYALSLLTVRLQADQVADEQGIEAGADYEADVARWEAEAEALPKDLRADYVTAMSTEAYLNSIMMQMGERDMGGEDQDFAQRGAELFGAEVSGRDAKVDPSFGVVFADGALALSETGGSIPVSGTALEALSDQPTEAYLDSLPESQRCG